MGDRFHAQLAGPVVTKIKDPQFVDDKLTEIEEGIAYICRRQDAVQRELKRMDATIFKAVDDLRMGAIITIIVLLSFVFAIALHI